MACVWLCIDEGQEEDRNAADHIFSTKVLCCFGLNVLVSVHLSVLLWSAVRLLYLSCWIPANFSGVFVCMQNAELIHKQNADHELLQP